MSGHSKWSKIKRQKGANDAKKGKIFTKLARNITLAAQNGGGDLELNFELRVAVDVAKRLNLPSDNIERAIKKGTGDLPGQGKIEEIIYEGYTSFALPVIIQAKTDNRNRTITEIRTTLEKNNGGKISPEGSVLWQFDLLGVILVEPKVFVESEKFGKAGDYEDISIEELELELFELEGIQDIYELDGQLVIEIEKDSFSNIDKYLNDKGIKIVNSSLEYVPQNEMEVEEGDIEGLDKLMEELEDLDDVDSVWHAGK